jgi:hypothetical protein
VRRENYIQVYFKEFLFVLALSFSTKSPLKMKVYLMIKCLAVFVISAFVPVSLCCILLPVLVLRIFFVVQVMGLLIKYICPFKRVYRMLNIQCVL